MFYSKAWTKCLICLIFLTSGNAECPKPQVEGNVVLTTDALLMNDFPEGGEATFECANGYLKEQGSERITCTSGKWSTLKLTCKKKDCGAPRKMPHLTYEFKEGTLFGASARAICDKGYQLMGPSYRQCYAIGWSGRPRCKVVTCDKPPEIMHGTIIEKPGEELPEYGGVIQYSCNEGYTLIGNKSIECIEDGEYNSLPPECKDVNDILLKPTTISTSSITTTSTVPPTIQDVNDILLKPTTISTSSITTTSTVPPTIQDVNDILLKPTTISTSSITTTSTVPPTIQDVNDILLKPTTISTSSITTTSTVPPTIRDVNDILLKPTTISTSSITTTSTVLPTIRDVNDILLKPTTISTSSITTTSTVPPTIQDVNDILLKPTTISTSSITTTSTVPPTIRDVNDILLKPTTISTSSITTTLTVLPTIRDVNDILLKPTTISTSSITTTSTVPPTIQDVNDILLKPTTISTSSITTTSTVPPTIRVSGRNNGVGEHDTNAEIAAVVGSGIGTVIITLIVLITRYWKRKGARTAPIC
ncbi:complement decay-accelerating factor isoform X19 [Oncorhynchus mykiss]|uniref:complement decay-accelerating factor isoform X19 n=1 Tax=Oncorhynchus mykiss TaxID=8022 RepID=UPI0018786C3A|nr:complement decay-accelerating factor isoform X19 [Oncorhynchus mykiss]